MSKTPEEKTHKLQPLAPGVWVMFYPLTVLGDQHGRVVTLLRLSSGKLIIHSTAPFSPEDVAEIRSVGEPGWLVEGNLHHDSYAREGQNAFPLVPYLAPYQFSDQEMIPAQLIVPPPPEWSGEVNVLEIEGAPSFLEHVFLHRSSRTLIVADLVSNFEEHETTWEWLVRHYALSLNGHPAVNRPFHAAVTDKEAFAGSIRTILSWDFDRIIVGHKQPVETNGKASFKEAILQAFPDLPL